MNPSYVTKNPPTSTFYMLELHMCTTVLSLYSTSYQTWGSVHARQASHQLSYAASLQTPFFDSINLIS